MDATTLVVITGTILTVLGVVFILRRKQRNQTITETDYRSLCNMGIIFLCAGIAISISTRMINPLLVLGFIFFGIGYANKDQWKPRNSLK